MVGIEFTEAVGCPRLRLRRYQDWHALLGRLGCRHCSLRCPRLHPGIITHASTRADGRHKCCCDYLWTGSGLWHRFRLRKRSWRLEVDGRTWYNTRGLAADLSILPSGVA